MPVREQKIQGARSGPAAAGGATGYYPTLNAAEQAAFANGISQFIEDEPVSDVPQGNGGLGPGFAAQLAANNVIFRILAPLFGLELVENTPDFALKSNLASTADKRRELGIGGRFNLSGNDGTIMKFGWKAQNKSLTIFAGEAYNVEMGISNDVMPNERNVVKGCVFNPTPEDSHSQAGASDVDAFVDAIRLAAPPTPAPSTADIEAGRKSFVKSWVRVVSLSNVNHLPIVLHRYESCPVSAVLRFCIASHGHEPGRRGESRNGYGRRI